MPLQITELQITVPSYFRCPISLELMHDPVTLCTGITYDRQSIEKWLDEGHNTCPATMQEVLHNQDLIPNHTLRRLIQAWCVLNTSNGVQRIPTPLPPADPHKVSSILQEIVSSRNTRLDLLKSHKHMAKSSDRNRRCLVSEGIITVLIDLIAAVPKETDLGTLQIAQEALGTLVLFSLDDCTKKTLVSTGLLKSISWLLKEAVSMETQIQACNLLENLCIDKSAIRKIGSTEGVIEGLTALLRQNLSPSATRSGMKTLLALCLPLKIRARIVELQAVPCIAELLPGANRSTREQAMALLSCLSCCAEGRAAMMSHALAMAAIVRSMTGVSEVTGEHCVDVLWSICVHACDEKLLQDVVKLGIFKNLLMLLQTDLSFKTRQRAKHLVKFFTELQYDAAC